MSILRPLEIYGTVTYLGVNRDRAAGPESEPLEQVEATWEGFAGDSYAGLTRKSCSRVKLQYERDTEIKNVRQLTIVSVEELADVAMAMGIAKINPAWIGASLAFAGIPELTLLPPGARLIFDSGASLAVDMENGPCQIAADAIERHHPGEGSSFPRLALHKRGVTAWVERPGLIRLGDQARVHTPPQRIYGPAVANQALEA